MSPFGALRGWRGPSLAWQIVGLLVGGLVIAQLVTLLLTMALPPTPTTQYELDDVAAALRGQRGDAASTRSLERRIQNGPPNLSGAGWLRSERSRIDLAQLLGADARDVRLGFFTPLPFAGTLTPDRRAATPALSALVGEEAFRPASYVAYLDGPPPGGGAGTPGGGFPGGGALGMPGGGLPGGGFGPRGGAGFPVESTRDAAGRDMRGRANRLDQRVLRTDRGDRPAADPGAVSVGPVSGGSGGPAGVREGARPAVTNNRDPAAPTTPPAASRAGPPAPVGGRAGRGSDVDLARPGRWGAYPGVSMVFPGLGLPDAPQVVSRMPAAPAPVPAAPAEAEHPAHRDRIAAPAPAPAPASALPLPRIDPPVIAPPAVALAPRTFDNDWEQGAEPQAVPLRAPPRSLFGLAPAPWVEGDFVAAWRQADGRWAVVQPAPEPVPTAWQRRLMLWFAVAFALVGPLGLLFARRLVKPLSGFAAAAEQLGRDPAASVLPLAGPAEIGRAANAFNVMQSRLRAFVDDRTAMVGAISHDLRTPLTRMRFRIEEVEDDAIRAGMIGEVEEMEAMIASVLDYIRDASSPGVRERLDLRLLVDDVVDDALLVGSDVRIERVEAAPVEVDVLGMRRVLDNLLQNAVKYGARARVRLRIVADEAVAEIIDDGPGLPDDELERVFEPFYRTPAAIASDKKGSGLGLAVCRSIARAHGGDVQLAHSADGFLAQVRVPLAYGAERQAA